MYLLRGWQYIAEHQYPYLGPGRVAHISHKFFFSFHLVSRTLNSLSRVEAWCSFLLLTLPSHFSSMSQKLSKLFFPKGKWLYVLDSSFGAITLKGIAYIGRVMIISSLSCLYYAFHRGSYSTLVQESFVI